MRRSHLVGSVVAAFIFSLSAVQVVSADEVKIEGVHLCCGGCVRGVSKALTGVEGVSDVKIERDEELVTFQAKDEAAVKAGLAALAKGGYYGKTSHAGPDFAIDPKAKKDTIEITEMHLCCAGCTNSAKAALKDVKGVKSISPESKQGKITITGSEISLAETLKALHAYGFHGTVK